MNHKVHCIKLDREAEGLAFQVWPGELGQRIYDNVSQQAWNEWIKHQTILVNENRINPIDPKGRQFIEQEMEKYFFGEGSDKPAEFTDQK